MATTTAAEQTVTLGRARHRMQVSTLAHKYLTALLAHQKEHRLPGDSYEPGKIDLRLISYTHLCRLAHAGDPHRTHGELDAIHKWCALNHWPPIDALVVDATARRPGPRYPENHHWERDAYAALLFHYPEDAARTAS